MQRWRDSNRTGVGAILIQLLNFLGFFRCFCCPTGDPGCVSFILADFWRPGFGSLIPEWIPRTGILLGNVNGSQCIIWDDPAIQVRSVCHLESWNKVPTPFQKETSSHVLFIWGVYTKCSSNFRVSSPDTCGTFCWIYSSWSSVLWKLHEIPKDALHPSHVFVCALVFAQKKSALASCFHDLISKVCMKNCFPIVNHPSPESFPNTIDRWQVKPMLFPEFWAPIGGFAGRQLPEALQLERVEIKVPWGKVSREFLDSWIDRKTWSVIVFIKHWSWVVLRWANKQTA